MRDRLTWIDWLLCFTRTSGFKSLFERHAPLQRKNTDRLLHSHHSTYRKGHSVENACLNVHHDLAEAPDIKRVAVFVRCLWCPRPRNTSSVSWVFWPVGIVLSWIQWQYRVCWGRILHVRNKCLKFNGPQGSFIEPPKYRLYAKPFGIIYQRHTWRCHCNADGTQVCVCIMPK